MIRESFEIALDTFKHRKLSSILTVLGIVIGIAAIISLVSIGTGMQEALGEALEGMGSDKIMIMPGSLDDMSGFAAITTDSLIDKDVEIIEDISGVKVAAGMLMKSLPIKFDDEVKSSYVTGLSGEKADKLFLEMEIFEINEGRPYKEGDSKVIVVGSRFADDIFEEDVNVGDTLYIKNTKFKVIGNLKSIGNDEDDSNILIPLNDMRELVGGKDSLTMVWAQVSNPSNIDSVAEKIEKKMEDKYGENTISTITSGQMAEMMDGIFSTISFVIGGIASIAMIVAGVGIANTMFTSVMERTKEIGVMKAIGATNMDVVQIFLVEAALLGLLGGVIGVSLGLLISYGITFAAGDSLGVAFEATVTNDMILFSLGFSLFVGIISGIYPARRAARLQPIEALRYE